MCTEVSQANQSFKCVIISVSQFNNQIDCISCTFKIRPLHMVTFGCYFSIGIGKPNIDRFIMGTHRDLLQYECNLRKCFAITNFQIFPTFSKFYNSSFFLKCGS